MKTGHQSLQCGFDGVLWVDNGFRSKVFGRYVVELCSPSLFENFVQIGQVVLYGLATDDLAMAGDDGVGANGLGHFA